MLRRKLAEWVYEILEQQDGTEAGGESRGEGQERGRGGGARLVGDAACAGVIGGGETGP